MTYTQAVEQAAAALVRGEDANWELARLTWENTIGAGDVRTALQSGRVRMETWCADVQASAGRRFGTVTGWRYKQVWAEHGLSDRIERLSWDEAYQPTKGIPRQEQVTPADTERFIEFATPERKQEVAAKLLSDPEVADAIIAQPETRRAVYESLNRQEQRAEVKRETIRASDPIVQRIDKETALLALEQLLRKFAEDARALVADIGTLPARSDGAIAPHLFLKQSFVAAEDALGGVRTLLETGTNDLDNFLSSVLKGEQ